MVALWVPFYVAPALCHLYVALALCHFYLVLALCHLYVALCHLYVAPAPLYIALGMGGARIQIYHVTQIDVSSHSNRCVMAYVSHGSGAGRCEVAKTAVIARLALRSHICMCVCVCLCIGLMLVCVCVCQRESTLARLALRSHVCVCVCVCVCLFGCVCVCERERAQSPELH